MTNSYRPSLIEEGCRHCYSLLLCILLPLVALLYSLKLVRGKSRLDGRLKERFALGLPTPKAGGLLVHCVSVGEVVTASKLIKAIRQQQPDLPITITTTTATGSGQVKTSFGDSVEHCYLPMDFPWFANKLLKAIRPSQVLITEVELWPNLIHQCWRQSVPVSVINARLTERSARRYSKLSFLFQPMLHKLSYICTQGERDQNNYLSLGADSDKVVLCHNLKFDLRINPEDQQRTQSLAHTLNQQQGLFIIGASTHEPEEQLLLTAFKSLTEQFPSVRLILVPRYPQRFEDVSKLCQQHGFKSQKLSDLKQVNSDTQVIVADVMGQLNSLYALADMAFVGGSIAQRGGHNPLEAAIHGMPIFMGPSRHNNPEICQVLAQAGALYDSPNAEKMVSLCQNWLNDPRQKQQIALSAKAVVEHNRGAIQNTLKRLALTE